jgi:ribose-phosphate pyrophosphokinase
MAESKPDVISVDWNADLLDIKKKLPAGIAIQGNLDPHILYADKKVIKERIHRLFERMRGEDGFIFNLGHGIMPDIPFDHVYGSPVILDYLISKELQDIVVVSPDVGGVARARAFAKKLNDAPLAIIDKRRQAHNVAEVLNVIGDVRGKTAILVDDMIDTGGTISEGAKLLRQEGASQVYACATHAVFSPPAIERLSSGVFEEVIVTNTIPIPEANQFPQLVTLSVANLLGEAIWRIHEDSSLSSLFR